MVDLLLVKCRKIYKGPMVFYGILWDPSPVRILEYHMRHWAQNPLSRIRKWNVVQGFGTLTKKHPKKSNVDTQTLPFVQLSYLFRAIIVGIQSLVFGSVIIETPVAGFRSSLGLLENSGCNQLFPCFRTS